MSNNEPFTSNVLFKFRWLIIARTIMLTLYGAWKKVIRRIFGVSYRSHNDIVIKLGVDTVQSLDRRMAKYLFN